MLTLSKGDLNPVETALLIIANSPKSYSLYIITGWAIALKNKPTLSIGNSTCDCSKIYITLIVCAPYFVNLNNNTFQLKTLLFFVHLRSQQNRTEKVISNYQIYSVAILTLLF